MNLACVFVITIDIYIKIKYKRTYKRTYGNK